MSQIYHVSYSRYLRGTVKVNRINSILLHFTVFYCTLYGGTLSVETDH